MYHIINRGVGRMSLFDKPADYDAFECVMLETQELRPLRLLAYCIMPNHWHLVVWPTTSKQLAPFMQRLTITHATRWLQHRQAVGTGHVYQGRFKSFPIEQDAHFLSVCRYVERNPLRANLVKAAQDWKWSSLHRRSDPAGERPILSDWPVKCPADWTSRVNLPQTDRELESIRLSVTRGQPNGGTAWVKQTTQSLELDHTLRSRGRPPKKKAGDGSN